MLDNQQQSNRSLSMSTDIPADALSDLSLQPERQNLAAQEAAAASSTRETTSNRGRRSRGSSTSGSTRTTRTSEPPETQLSKSLSYILRHGALSEGLSIRQDGYIELDKVLARPKVAKIRFPLRAVAGKEKEGADASASGRAPDVQDVLECVELNAKKRFEVSSEAVDGSGKTVLYIRAVQGHSLKQVTSLSHTPLTLSNLSCQLPVSSTSPSSPTHPEYALVHGTSFSSWSLIKQTGGLLTMTRNHVHLAKGKPGQEGVISGMRTSSEVVIWFDVRRAMGEGVEFDIASNGAVLTSGVPYSSKKYALPTEEPNANPTAVRTNETSKATGMDGAEPATAQSTSETPTADSTDTQTNRPSKPSSSSRKYMNSNKKKTPQQAAAESTGILPLKYVARVEDKAGRIIWTPEGGDAS